MSRDVDGEAGTGRTTCAADRGNANAGNADAESTSAGNTDAESTSAGNADVAVSRRSVLQTTATAAAGLTLGGAGLSAAQTGSGGPSGLDGRSWEQTWSDEFDGGSIDTSVWSFETGGGCGENGTLGSCNWGNNEEQYYTDGDNAWVENGRLVIEAREEQVQGPDATYQYTSSRMVTAGSVSKKYGRIDVRAKMPIGQGLWPALWMLPEPFVTWPDEGEIDIMEYLGHQPSRSHGTLHGPGYSGADGYSATYRLDSGTFADSFHVFSLVWEPDYLKWYVDGTQFHEVRRSEVESAGNEWVFDDKPFHLLFNIAVGGSWPGYPDDTTQFPQQLEVDYVRFFEEAEGSTPTDTETPCEPTTITPYVRVDGGSWQNTASVTVESGSTVEFGPQPSSGGSWSWSGPGLSGSSREVTVSPSTTGTTTYTATYTNDCGETSTRSFTVTVESAATPTPTGCDAPAAPTWSDGTTPHDVDNDGVYEDMNGNCEFDSDDVVTYFQEIDRAGIQNNAWAYDANGNGNADFDDVVTLFQEL